MTTRRCPRCQSTFSPPARYCVRDGFPLVESGSFGETAQLVSGRPRTVTPAAGPVAAAKELTGQTFDNRFEILEKVGEGGMARVYAARESGSDTRLAIKVLNIKLVGDPAAAARLRREAQLAQRLHHPNVCPILGFGRTPDGLHYLVMPFLDGETLSERELREGPMAVGPAIDLVRQICSGLAHAHGRQVLHRDLKPENVMLVPDRRWPLRVRAVVTDFGLAKEFEAGREVRKITATGIVVGTPEFLSPEQVRGRPLDPRSDVFALGVLAFELLTGQLPFAGESAQDLMLARLQGRPRRMRTFLPEVSERLEATVARALTRDPAGRYPTMDAFAEALAPFSGTGRRP